MYIYLNIITSIKINIYSIYYKVNIGIKIYIYIYYINYCINVTICESFVINLNTLIFSNHKAL